MQEFTIDLFDPAVRRDPYPHWARLREMDRVVRSPSLAAGGFAGSRGRAFVVHRFEDVRRVFADHDTFSSARLMGQGGTTEEAERSRSRLMDLLLADPDTRALFEDPEMHANLRAGLFSGTTMLSADPPEHNRLRGVVSKAFFPRQVSALEGKIRELTQDLVRPLADGGEHDLIDTLAGPLPSIVIAEMLGIPREDHEMFKEWSNAVVGSIDADELNVEDPLGRLRSLLVNPTRMRLIGEFRQYLGEQIDRYRVERGDNLISRMVEANEHEVLTAEELTASTFLLLIAGNETTTRLIANLAVALHRHPDQQALLVEDPSLIPAAVEEGLRYDSPVQTMSRLSTAETEFGDQVIPAGRVVTMVMAAANRDPEQFEDPDRFDVRREASAHVSFGYGIHFCLGAPLARRESRIAFEELLRVAPNLRVTNADDLVYRPVLGATLRGPESVVVTA